MKNIFVATRKVGKAQPEPQPEAVSTHLPYEDFGYIPDVAQAAQSGFYPNPHLNPQPYFSKEDYAVANWFTTRVHLSPLGKAITNE